MSYITHFSSLSSYLLYEKLYYDISQNALHYFWDDPTNAPLLISLLCFPGTLAGKVVNPGEYASSGQYLWPCPSVCSRSSDAVSCMLYVDGLMVNYVISCIVVWEIP